MDPEGRQQDPFLQHLSESEKRLGASRHSVFDALFVGAIVVLVAGGFVLGIMRLRAITTVEAPPAPTVAPPSAPVAAPAAEQPARDEKPVAAPTTPVAEQKRPTPPPPPTLPP